PMRIHHVSPEATGIVWQIQGCGVRAVLIRDKPLPYVFAVSSRLRRSVATTADGTLGFSYRITHAPITDLFPAEQDARIEYRRRQVLLHGPAPRTRRRNVRDAALSA